MTIETKFEMFETVKIKPLENHKGKIVGILYDIVLKYEVRCFSNSEIKSFYVMEDELEKI